MPIQQMLIGSGAVATKTYVDDVFSTYLYPGNSSNRTITNNLDLSTENGLVWVKRRSSAADHHLTDTVTGANKYLQANGNDAQVTTETDRITGFTTSGFTLGSNFRVNDSGHDYSSWSFRKAPGFFDIVTYEGTGGAHFINHSLGCKPGLILVKNLDSTEDWAVYHTRSNTGQTLAGSRYGKLNSNVQFQNSGDTGENFWGTDPTSTQFCVGTADETNKDDDNYVAYLFAGGESVSNNAVSVEFDGTDDYLSIASSSDFAFGTGDFTFEGWLKPNDTTDQYFLNFGADNPSIAIMNNKWSYYDATSNMEYAGSEAPAIGQWTHFAISRESSTIRLFINGELKNSFTSARDFSAQALTIGAYSTGTYKFDGSMSNVRIVKGTAVYTTSFRPPTEPLTNITNTVLLCCNTANDATGSTVTPGTITNNGSAGDRIFSPFDDPLNYVFGENGDQNLVKCGSYIGNGSSTGPEVYIGWEPQWLLIKNADDTAGTTMFDIMRGIPTAGNDSLIETNSSGGESAGANFLDLTSTGFQLKANASGCNLNEDQYLYIAIRRPDGYVGKPIETGTGAFAMDTGASQLPVFDSGFTVDFALMKAPNSSQDWYPGARLIQGKFLETSSSDAAGTNTEWVFDFNDGWNADNSSFNNSNYQSWMFKRHAGLDVITYTGNGAAGRHLPHSLNKAPEMVWIKCDRDNHDWVVGHIGLDGGTNPWQKWLKLNAAEDQADQTWPWNDTAPNANHLVLGNGGMVNGTNDPYIAMLFASVPGVSKVGYFSGSDDSKSISLGFQPRFFLLKNIDADEYWPTHDSLRGFDERLAINNANAQANTGTWVQATSTGVTLVGNNLPINKSGNNYIYYAHA